MTTAPVGLLVIDKPAGITSHDVVARTRRLVGTRRVGHAGTLDPMATGVLVLGIGRATRLLTYLVGHDKEYVATVRLGADTTTDDAEGEVITHTDARHVDPDAVRMAIAAMVGPQMQRPSAVSAIKVDGVRSYRRVREGEDVVLPERPVTVSSFVMTAWRLVDDMLDVDVSVTVSSGTYVRALARDLGARLGVGGHLTALRRTRSGPFTLDDAHTWDAVEAAQRTPVIGLAAALPRVMPVVALDDASAAAIRHGRRLRREDCPGLPPVVDEGNVGALDASGDALAVLQLVDGMLAPRVVFTE